MIKGVEKKEIAAQEATEREPLEAIQREVAKGKTASMRIPTETSRSNDSFAKEKQTMDPQEPTVEGQESPSFLAEEQTIIDEQKDELNTLKEDISSTIA